MVFAIWMLGGCERADAVSHRQSERISTASPLPIETPRAPAASSPSPDPSLTVLAEALASKDYESRMIAVEAIGEAHLAELTPWLENALGDPEHDVRMLAVEALGKLGTPAARAALMSVRDDTSEKLDVRALAAAQLLRRTRP
jgi:HEAT repeat protein